MTTLLDFIKIARIDGVASYCLLRDDGQCLAGTAMYTKNVCTALSRIAKRGQTRREKSDFPPLSGLWIRGTEASLLLIPMGNYTVGVTPSPGRPENDVMTEVLAFLQRIRHQHTVSQKS